MSSIIADKIVVEFPVYGGKSRSVKNTVIRAATGGVLATDAAERTVVRAIDHLNFQWREGDRIGLFGHNGSGKTTLLRTLAGIYEPISGSLEVNGRVASMLSITLGMENEATGVENVYLRGTMMGLTRRQIANLMDDVCDFAELGDYIYMPMRTYSSGMQLRLAFAISTSIDAEIILMDEWLSVGDAKFAEKSKKRLAKLLDKAKILVLASHDKKLLHTNCNQVVHLDHGQIVSTSRVSQDSGLSGVIS